MVRQRQVQLHSRLLRLPRRLHPQHRPSASRDVPELLPQPAVPGGAAHQVCGLQEAAAANKARPKAAHAAASAAAQPCITADRTATKCTGPAPAAGPAARAGAGSTGRHAARSCTRCRQQPAHHSRPCHNTLIISCACCCTAGLQSCPPPSASARPAAGGCSGCGTCLTQAVLCTASMPLDRPSGHGRRRLPNISMLQQPISSRRQQWIK